MIGNLSLSLSNLQVREEVIRMSENINTKEVLKNIKMYQN